MPYVWVPRYSAEVLLDSPLLYWRMNETSGTTLADSSGNGRTGSTNFAPTLAQTGPITVDPGAKSILFAAGSTQVISSTYGPFSANSQRTFEMWAKKTSARVDSLFGSGGGAGLISFTITNNGDGPPYHMQLRPNGGTSTGNWNYVWPNTSAFHHVVLTVDDSAHTAQLYIDGASQGTVSSIAAWGEDQQFWLALASNYFTGNICEVAVYSGLLSSTRVSAHYSAATTKFRQAMAAGRAAVGRSSGY